MAFSHWNQFWCMYTHRCRIKAYIFGQLPHGHKLLSWAQFFFYCFPTFDIWILQWSFKSVDLLIDNKGPEMFFASWRRQVLCRHRHTFNWEKAKRTWNRWKRWVTKIKMAKKIGQKVWTRAETGPDIKDCAVWTQHSHYRLTHTHTHSDCPYITNT